MAKIGAEAVCDYVGTASDLYFTTLQAQRFYDTLHGTRAFIYFDAMAWDQDFEQQGLGATRVGADEVFVERADIVFFSGHGCSTGFFFGELRKDNSWAENTEVRWGDAPNGRLKWVALDACQVLEDPGAITRWRNAFNGIHYMLGFHSVSTDESKRGRIFAQELNAGRRVERAWIRACEETEDSSGEWAMVRAEGAGASTHTWDDHWPGTGGRVSPDPSPPSRFVYARGTC
jgi:hypothetical protein